MTGNNKSIYNEERGCTMMGFLGRCFGKWIGMVAIIVVAVVQLADPFPTQAWWNSYDGGFHDAGNGVAIDSNGNVIVVGYRGTEAFSPPHVQGNNAYMRKYDHLGAFVCDKEVMGPGTPAYPEQREVNESFNGVAVDSQDNIIVTGNISGDFYNGGYYVAMYLNKYDNDKDCTPVWGAPVIYKYPVDSAWQGAYSVTLDTSDNIYATGNVFAGWGSSEHEWATWKYDTSGVLQTGFPILYNYSPSYAYPDYSQDVAVDSLGNIIIVGFLGQAAGNYNWHVRKYDASGTLLWTDTYTGAANLNDIAYRVAVDSENNPIVVGYTNKGTDNSTNANYDWLMIKYAADGVAGAGQRLWEKTYESASGQSEAAYAVAVDGNDNVIVGGSMKTGGVNINGRLAVLDGATGELLGEKIITDPANVYPMRLAYRNGAIAIGGYIWDPAGANNNMYVALLNSDLLPPVTTASPAGGLFRTAQKVTLSTNEPAKIYYTTNGADPTTASRKYTLPISVKSNTTLKFFAVDTAGNAEQVKTETYVFDTIPPVNGILTIAPGAINTTFDLSWEGFSDALSGLASYKLVFGTASYPACSAASLYSGTGTAYSHEGRTLGKTYYYRVCAIDNVGNISTGAKASKKVLPEYEPPTDGSVIINDKATYTKTAKVTLTLSATDTSIPMRMCVSNGATCKSWVAYAPTKSWTLSAGSGEKTVNVWFRDKYGNANTKPYSDTIILDTKKPVDGTLSIALGASNTTFDLSWSAASDALSGLASYKLVFGTAGYPACSAALLYSGPGTTFSHEGLTVGKTYYYRVCARDNAGNISKGAKAKRKVLP